MDDRGIRERVARVEEALEQLEGLPASPRETAMQAVAALVELYGEGWARALACVDVQCPGGAAALAEDELVSHLLMIHGLHPTDVEGRVRGALEEVGTVVNADGLEVELLGIEEGVASLRFGGNGHTPVPGLKDLVEQTVFQAAPELERVDIEMPASAGSDGPVLVQLRRPRREEAEGAAAREEA